jgi:hypothetical protein
MWIHGSVKEPLSPRQHCRCCIRWRKGTCVSSFAHVMCLLSCSFGKAVVDVCMMYIEGIHGLASEGLACPNGETLLELGSDKLQHDSPVT